MDILNKTRNFFLSLLLLSVGRLSRGVELCLKFGPGSAKKTGHIYKNRAEGRFLVGVLIDRVYLNHPSRRAIRQRAKDVAEFIKQIVRSNREKGQRTLLLDAGAGYPHYILDALKEVGHKDVEVICFDNDPGCAEETRGLFSREGFDIRYEVRDFFACRFSASSQPPDIIILSGAGSWLTDDISMAACIGSAYERLSEGGHIIITEQIKPLDQGLVLAVSGQRGLRPRCSSLQAISDSLRNAGFSNFDIKTDKWGYYCTIKGQKRSEITNRFDKIKSLPEISVILPVHNEKENIPELVRRLTSTLDSSVGRDKWELLFIDDGSSDGSSELLNDSAQRNKNIRVYAHQARSGQAQAFNTGFRNSAGRLVVTMDADLQVFPEDLPLFFQKIEEGYDAVNGYRRNRKDSPLINFYSFIFNIFVRTLLSSCVSDAASNYTAIKRQFIDGLELSGNDHRYIIPIVKRRGGIRVAEVVIRHQRRQKGKSKYKLTKCLNAFPEIISFWFRLRSGGYDSNSG